MSKQGDEKRMNELVEMISSMASLDFTKRIETKSSNNLLDIIAQGLNMLSEELEENVVEKSILAHQNEELNEALAYYKYALDQSTIVAITNVKGHIEYVNDMYCKMSKYSQKELIGANPRIVNSGYHTKKFWQDMWKTLVKGNVWHNEIKNKAKDGTTYWLQSTIVPFLDTKGKPERYLAMYQDISIRKQREEELTLYHLKLKETNKNLEEFAYTAAHDMKSPLNSANGLISLLEMELKEINNERIADYLVKLKDTFDSTKQLINGILDYSKMGLTEIKMEQFDLCTLIAKITNQYSSNKKVVIYFKKLPLIVKHNKTALTQVIDNLFSNAIKYNDKEICEITVQCIEKKTHFEISISDNGPGIANKDKEKVFNLFENLNTSNTNSTGIGLATVKKIITETNGKIWIDSSEGQGTTIVFTINK